MMQEQKSQIFQLLVGATHNLLAGETWQNESLTLSNETHLFLSNETHVSIM